MHIQSIHCFKGRNIYSHRKALKMILDIAPFENGPTRDIQDFNKRLLESFPNLAEHTCGVGYRGGFGERLIEGTYIGHVTEHLIIEVQNILGYPVKYGRTRQIEDSSCYCVVCEYENETVAIECAKKCVEFIILISSQNKIAVTSKQINEFRDNMIFSLRELAARTDLGPSTRAIFDEAIRRGIPVNRVQDSSVLKLGYGKYSRCVQASLTDKTSCIAVDIVSDKEMTKRVLLDNGIPAPYGVVVLDFEEAKKAAEDIKYPVVVKPADSNQGKGVTININDNAELEKAYYEALIYSRKVIVEDYIQGYDYRVLVVGGRVSAVAKRIPPCVTGDGIHNMMELVNIENENPLRGNDHEKPLTKLRLDEIARRCLAAQGLSDKYIPFLGEKVFIRHNANLSTGGTAIDCTELIHPQNAAYAIAAANALCLDVAGIDFVCPDISIPISKGGSIIEVNAAPGLRMHMYPSEGQPINVAADIMNMLYPENEKYTIPIVAITGTNGKTTTTRLIRHTLSKYGICVGMTTTSGIYIGNECIQKGDMTGPVSASRVLYDKRVEAAVLETARGGIVRKGLGYDLADVAVLTNISDDHLGLDGVNTMEDLANIKALVVEAVKPSGFAVLNADDAMTPYMQQRVRSKVILFAKSGSNALIKRHLKQNDNTAVYVKDNYIWISTGTKRSPLMALEDIPITMDGLIECNIENSLAAISALIGLSMSYENIRRGLSTFKPDAITNPGRFNIFDVGSFKIMVDYSHNIAGYSAVIKYIQKLKPKRLVGVVGMPGDRLDSNIKEVALLCAKSFNRVYIKEDVDLRGRKPGEVAGIMQQEMLSSGMNPEDVEVVLSEIVALEKAMLDALPNDLIVLLYEDFDSAISLITKFKNQQEAVDLLTQNILHSDVSKKQNMVKGIL